MKEQLYECGFLDTLEQMSYPTDKLYQAADEFVVKHFGYEDDEAQMS